MRGALKWVMATLAPQKGKEGVAQGMIERIKSQAASKGIDVVSGGGRTLHCHILCEEHKWGGLRMEKWPGIIKRDAITESQASFVRQIHESRCSVTNGPQQGGCISASM